MNRRTELAIYAVSGLLLAGTAAMWWQGIRPSPSPAVLRPVGVVEEADAAPVEVEEIPEMIFVHIAGAVEKPGVYEVPSGQRLFQALEMVGLLPDADLSSMNLASALRDSQKIYVPAVGEEPPKTAGSTGGDGGYPSAPSAGYTPPSSSFPVNVNTATQSELEQLPGIGPVLARAIISRREDVGPFHRPEDLRDVSGIGNKTFEKIAPYVVVK